MKKMVITGVNGFIGRHAKEYFEKEYEITGLDLAANYSGEREPDDTMTYYQCNMSQESAEMAAIFTGVQPDVILHCAGSANVGASVVNPMADLDGNLHSLYQLLLASLRVFGAQYNNTYTGFVRRLIEHLYSLRLVCFDTYVCIFQAEDMAEYVNAADKLVTVFKNDAVIV